MPRWPKAREAQLLGRGGLRPAQVALTGRYEPDLALGWELSLEARAHLREVLEAHPGVVVTEVRGRDEDACPVGLRGKDQRDARRDVRRAVVDPGQYVGMEVDHPALASISLVSVRPQPFELLAYCDVRAGRPDLAVKAMQRALVRDPDNWEYQYGLALVRASAGLDPRPHARAALRLNPQSLLAQAATTAFRTDNPGEWKRRAAVARLPIAP